LLQVHRPIRKGVEIVTEVWREFDRISDESPGAVKV